MVFMKKMIRKSGVVGILAALSMTLSPMVASAAPEIVRVFDSAWRCQWTRMTEYNSSGVCEPLGNETGGLIVDNFSSRGGSFSMPGLAA